MKTYGLPARIIEIDNNNYPVNELVKLIKENKINSIIASDELTTILTARNIIHSGFLIPKDVAMIGFTNGKMVENFIPSISSIDQKAKEQGEMAIQTLIDRIEGRLLSKPLEHHLKATIIHRESTRV